MIFYPRYIADLQMKTGQFSMLERGALDSLLDHLYFQETPYIESLSRALLIARANSKAEKSAVRYALEQCFELTADGRYFQKRAAIEIPKAQLKIEAARKNGLLGGRPRQPSGLPIGLPHGLASDLPDGLSSQNHNQIQIATSFKLVANNNNHDEIVPSTSEHENHDSELTGKAGGCCGDGGSIDCSEVTFPRDLEMPYRPAFEAICHELQLSSTEEKHLGIELVARIAIGKLQPKLRILHTENWLRSVVIDSRSSGEPILRAGIEFAQKEELNLAKEKIENTRIQETRAEADIAKQRTEKTADVIARAGETQLQLIVDKAASLLPTTSRGRFETVLRDSVLQRKIPTGIGGSAVKRAVEALGFMSMVGQ